MSVLSRSALEASPLADLHAIASELGIDGFRRLRKADLVDAIVRHQSGDDDESVDAEAEVAEAEVAEDLEKVEEAASEPPARPRRRRGGRGRTRDEDEGAEVEATDDLDKVEADAEEPRGRDRDRDRRDRDRDKVVEGVVELLTQRLGLPAPLPARHVRRRRLHLRRAGAPLRARGRRSRERAGAPAAPLGALPLARPRRHDQRRAGRRGRRGHAVRRAALRLADRAPRRSAARTRRSRRSSG